jgi:hypothetical protein
MVKPKSVAPVSQEAFSFWGVNREELVGLVGVVVVWRVFLLWLGSLAGRVFEYAPSFPYADALLPKYGLPQWLYSWANFDGVHYLTIAEKGYIGTGLIQAFFPVFPGLMAGLNVLVSNTLVAGLVVVHIALVAAVIGWYGWIKSLSGSQVAWTAVLVLLLWPASFFLGAVYSESVFLALVVFSLWAMKRRQWWVASLLAMVASATRVVGLGLMVALWIEWGRAYWPHWRQARWWRQEWRQIVVLFIPVLGLLAYMAFLVREFHDPVYFLHVQAEFGGGRQESLVLLPRVFWRYGRMLAGARSFDWKYYAIGQELVAAVGGGLGLLAAGWWGRRQPNFSWGAWVFAVAAFILPTLTGTFSSLPRYILVCLPIWWLVAVWLSRHRWWRLVYYCLGMSWLMLNVWLFIQGYWVA